MHCGADLTEELEAADADGDGTWDQSEVESWRSPGSGRGGGSAGSGELLADDGLLDNTLTVLVGIAGGLVVGVVGTGVLLVVTGSGFAFLFGLLAWLGSTAYLVRRRTVQEAVTKGGYAVAVVLLSIPLIAISPVVDMDGGPGARVGGFVVLLVLVAVPAGIAAVVGFVASRYVPEGGGGSEG